MRRLDHALGRSRLDPELVRQLDGPLTWRRAKEWASKLGRLVQLLVQMIELGDERVPLMD